MKEKACSYYFCILEDDSLYRKSITSILSQYSRVVEFADLGTAKDFLRTKQADHNKMIFFIDIHLGDKPIGLEMVRFCHSLGIYSVILSGSDDGETIQKSFECGASDYFLKGEEVATIDDVIERFLNLRSPDPNVQNIIQTTDQSFSEKVFSIAKHLSDAMPILIQGPTGCGKTYVAGQFHQFSKPNRAFVSLNCNSVAKDLFESEMFGHKKGSFSGAHQDYPGKILQAHEGTLYLDEIDSMPLEHQAKLLKVLEEKSFYPVGSNKLMTSQFSLICSAQRPLLDLVRNGEFREDLFFRISYLKLDIPALKHRVADIMPLLHNMLNTGARRYYFASEATAAIEDHDWPGNIRELKIFAYNLSIMQKSFFQRSDVMQILQKPQHCNNFIAHDDSFAYNFLTPAQAMKVKEMGLDEFISALRKDIIHYFLEQNQGETLRTIKELGISTATFYRWRDAEIKNNTPPPKLLS